MGEDFVGFPPSISSAEPAWGTHGDPPAAATSRIAHGTCIRIASSCLQQNVKKTQPIKAQTPPQSLARGPAVLPDLRPWEDAAPDSSSAGRDRSAAHSRRVPAPKQRPRATSRSQWDQSSAQTRQMHLCRAQRDSGSRQNSSVGNQGGVPSGGWKTGKWNHPTEITNAEP